MSERIAIKLVRQFIDALNARDGERVSLLVTDDVAHDHAGKREIGTDALRAFFANHANKSGETLSDAVILTDQGGGRAAVEFTRRGRDARGVSYSNAGGWFFEIDDGRISRITDYSAG